MRSAPDGASVFGSPNGKPRPIMNTKELADALVKEGAVERQEDGEAVLEALASIIWHALEHNDVIEWSRVGQLGIASAPRRRRSVTFYPASELEVAVNRHHVGA
jgi:hypothetical protein